MYTCVSPDHFCIPLKVMHSVLYLYVLEPVVFKPDVLKLNKNFISEALSTHDSTRT